MEENKKRVHRFEKIPQIEPPLDINDWLNKDLFPIEPYSIFKLRDGIMRIPEIEYKAIEIFLSDPKEKKRADQFKENEKYIFAENHTEKLFEYLQSDKFRDSRLQIIDRMIKIDTNVYKMFLANLFDGMDDNLFDNCIRGISRLFKRIDISKDLIDIIKSDRLRDPIDHATILQALGLSKDRKYIPILFSFYQYYKDNFFDEYYYEGPLFGLSYIL